MNTIHRWNEYEDWVEFYSTRELAFAGDGKYEAVMNFGGPGAATPYHFYARVKAGSETIISRVEVEQETFAPGLRVAPVKGTPAGFSWVYLGFAKMRRNYRKVTLTAPQGLNELDRLCVIEVVRRLESGEIERRIARDGMPPEPLSGVPLGGVGAGKIELCRDGLFRNITINGNIETPVWRTEGAFFAVRAECEGKALGRIISTECLHGLAPVESLRFEGVYPRAVLIARDRYFPLSIDVQATGTIIPRNVKDSALPAALFRVRLTADGDKPVKATLAFCMENFLGYGGSVATLQQRHTFDEGYYKLWEERTGNIEQPWNAASVQGLLFDGGIKEEKRTQGQYVLAASDRVSSRLMGWRFEKADDTWSRFVDSGKLPDQTGTPSQGEKTAGAIAVEVNLEAGESRELCFVFAWHTPNFWQGNDIDYSHYYCNDYSSAEAVAVYALANFDRLEREAGEVPDLLTTSSLPAWLSRSLCNDAYTFSTATWLTKDGRFAVNEGPSHMFGCMGTLDQKLYANHYYSLFFPELDRIELLGFARAQGPDGGIQHDLGYGHLEQKGHGHGWPDLSSALAILSLKHYQLTGDQSYIDEVYPCLVKALLEYQLKMDSDNDGIANISGVGNTFDAEKYEGTSSYIASLWLAALKALEELARRRDDTAVANRCRTCFEKARANAIDELWNGLFFANYYDSTNKRRCPNSHFSQVAGEFFAQLCGLGPLYGDHYVRQALLSMMRLNFHPRLNFPTNEATPEGKMPYRLMWGWLPHGRVYLGGTPLYFGLAEEGMLAMERMEKAIADINHDNRWDQRLFYEPDTGKEHWGRFYMTAPATWYVYQALLGYRWDQPEGMLSLTPNLPDRFMPFEGPLFLPDVWFRLTIDRDRTRMSLKVIKRFGGAPVIRKLVVRRHPGNLIVTTDAGLAPIRITGSSQDESEACYACSIDLCKISTLNLDFS